MSSPSSVSSSAPASATATSLDRQQTHIAREARVLHESVLKRVTAAEAEAALAAAKASTLMRGVETDALTALQQMEQMALYDLDAGVKEQLSAAQTRATDVQDENVRRLIFDNLYADVADETKKRQERLEFEQATQNASLYYRPAHEEEPPADSDDDDADSGSGGNAGGSGSGSSGAPVEGHKGVFATVF